MSLLLPLVPQAFFALFGAQAAGIVNPVNPLLSAGQLVEILRAANTKVLVALGPAPGTDIWDKVMRIKAELPGCAPWSWCRASPTSATPSTASTPSSPATRPTA